MFGRSPNPQLCVRQAPPNPQHCHPERSEGPPHLLLPLLWQFLHLPKIVILSAAKDPEEANSPTAARTFQLTSLPPLPLPSSIIVSDGLSSGTRSIKINLAENFHPFVTCDKGSHTILFVPRGRTHTKRTM